MSKRAKPHVGERIRQARLNAELTPAEIARRTPRQSGPLTQQELADRMGIRRDNLNKMEKKGGVGAVNARRLAKALGGNPEDWVDARESGGLQAEIDELRGRISELEARLS